jgi:hypothetical protein
MPCLAALFVVTGVPIAVPKIAPDGTASLSYTGQYTVFNAPYKQPPRPDERSLRGQPVS